jgi:hypothetical protein
MAPPILPRAEVLDDLRTALLQINGAPNWNYQIKTVQIGRDITRKFNVSDLPLVMLDPQEDVEERETMGGATANRHHRRWSIELTAVCKPDSDADIRAEGERFLADIMKKLLTITVGANSAGIVMIARRILGAENFERSENKTVFVGVDLDVIYQVVARDL